ncbi:LuxR C-terminal-related transcriptional regulator [Cupriavidus basilensis]|uniref:LuxR C-terminal-related transcriptional regulator n=1 Tax=Cupriavidus basilensis TaxID=68895 RepID=A0ABT6B534_9BURK|nr:LuxR C-terminal-related transcriptional regulator [Cupriavidus basilensis]MDF3839980.1 LuxR C-terminal-related transcriptional regulator [Cupriavidus basilensis]
MNGQLRDILTTLPKLSVSQIQELHTAIHAMQAEDSRQQPSQNPQRDRGVRQQELGRTDHGVSGRAFTRVESAKTVHLFHPASLRRVALLHGKAGANVAQTTAQVVASATGDTAACHPGVSASPATARPGCEANSAPLPPTPHHAPIKPDVQRLTERQQVVLSLVLEGLPTKLIARRLGLTVNTVKEHVSAILERLGARTRAQLLSKTTPFHAGDSSPPVCPTSDVHDQTADPAQGSTTIESKALGLTDRQGIVLRHLLDGLPNKAIAQRLGLTENTVKEHVSAILLQLGARSRLQVISKMRQLCVAPPVSTG